MADNNSKESEDTNDQNGIIDDQNHEIDIDKINSDFIREIDSIRSKVNPKDIFPNNKISVDNLGVLSSKIEIKDNDYPYESRCHAFYRLIGLPVVDPKSKGFYSPGFNKDVYANEESKKMRIDIANKLLEDSALAKMLDDRCQTPKTYQGYFLNRNINSGLTALTSSNQNNIRKFTLSLDKSDPTKPYESIKQDYSVEMKNSRGDDLSDYKDLNSDFTDDDFVFLSNNQRRSHIIKPFIVDPRIDFSVIPAKNRIAAPFLKNKAALKISDGVYLQRPYLENVCRIRFNNLFKGSLTQSQKDTLNNIKNNDSYKDIGGLKKYTDLTVNESEQFLKFYKVFEAMCKKLRDSVEIIKSTEQEYNWIPLPDAKGPEYGSETLDVASSVSADSILFNSKEDEIINKTIQDELDSILVKTIGSDSVDLGDFVLGGVSIAAGSPDPENSRSFGDHNALDLDKMVKARNEKCQKANLALKDIELILGEFSGFGFCDIIAVYAALWLIEPQFLEGLLDADAFNASLEAKSSGYTPFNTENSQRPEITLCLTELESKVKEMYQLMQKIYEDLQENNSKSSS